MKKRIGILGIGGIGGYFGGLMAMNFEEDPSYEIIFIARGQTKANIKQKGLILQSIEDSFVIHPDLVSDDPKEIGQLDLLIACVKSYSLADAVSKYVGNIKAGGAVLTLQNAVNQREMLSGVIREDIDHLTGCVYIISNIKSPGHIVRQKGPDKISFGKAAGESKAHIWIDKLFKEARITANLVDNIDDTIWNKYLFISPVATATSYFESPIGDVVGDNEKRNFLKGLITEAKQVAKGLGINAKPEIEDEVLGICSKLNGHSKTSMQLDFEQGNSTELAGLTTYIIEECEKLGIDSKHYKTAHDRLSSL